jgi:hypothetical protein
MVEQDYEVNNGLNDNDNSEFVGRESISFIWSTPLTMSFSFGSEVLIGSREGDRSSNTKEGRTSLRARLGRHITTR